jgi:hypothetical protein
VALEATSPLAGEVGRRVRRTGGGDLFLLTA